MSYICCGFGKRPWFIALAFAASPLIALNAATPTQKAARPMPKHVAVKSPQKTVTVTGQMTALIRGEAVPITVMGDIRTLDVLLERRTVSKGWTRLKGTSDVRGKFAVKDVPPGKYLLRVRIPELALDRDLAELYRAEVEVTAERNSLRLQMPYLVMRATESNGAPFSWETLVVNVKREGGELRQNWNLIFRREPGANPAGPVEEKGGVIIHIERQDGQVNFGYSWSSKNKNFLMFPVVEEDVPVRYYMTLSEPKEQIGYRRFEVRRGACPPELDFTMAPFRRVSGTVILEKVPGRVNTTRVSLSIFDAVDKVAIFVRNTTPDPDGKFAFEDVPPGLAWIAASQPEEGAARTGATIAAAEWLTLGVKPADGKDADKVKLAITPESGKATTTRFQELQQFKPMPDPPIVRPAEPDKNPAAPAA